ncbi:hypothetical protein B0H16DRAFT_1491769 [Mycena metata]|uniref:Uncharacterized protein n=1 Tax=Mycena metata TaxID=1033252 RepID=A0AAD7KF10_9AGAR|nr:hypothetical protein B0H16DRAFT_1491769 [Mycena metata]
MSQFAEETSRVLKLAKTEHDGLLVFAKLDRAEQLVSVAGHLFKLSRTISTIQPADALWTVPSFLKKRIEDNVAILMMDSSIPAYRSEDIGTPKLLLDLLVANDTAWGYTEEIRTDPYKVEVLDACMSRAMVTARNGFKNTLKKSCGSPPAEGQTLRTGALNIVALTEALLKQFKHVKTGRVVIDVALCGRIAVLRQLVLEKNDNSYWTDVDSYLASLRTSYPDKVQYSRFVKRKILDVDFDLYGRVSIDGYPSTRRAEPATPVQSSSSAAGTPQ